MKRSSLPFILTFLFLSSVATAQFCTTDNRFTEQEFFTDSQITSRLDVTYGSAVDWQGNTVDLKMDVYFPKFGVDPLAERPFIMMIHGGGFKGGTKEGMANYCTAFAKRGFVAATIQYRLGWDQTNPSDQILASYRAHQDANAALRFVVRHASKARIDTDWLFIGGSSAGSVTSLNAIYVSQQEWEAIVPGITALLGPLNSSGNNINTTFDLQGIFNNWGMTLDGALDPADMIPSVAFHGVLDGVTPIGTVAGFPGGPLYSGSGTIHNYLLANDVCSELTVDSMGRHGIYRGIDGEIFRVSRATCFFKSVFCDNCVSNYFVDSVAADCSTPIPTSLVDLQTSNTTNATAFSVFPNPSDEVLNIKGDLEGYQLRLINTSGQVVRHIDYGATVNTVNVADLAPGLYFLQAINGADERIALKKVLVQ
ncbi:MAG: T9SS type A sorting domain-containing protein [Bacteroidota bacterium]